MVKIVHTLRERSGQSGRRLLKAVGLAHSSFMRWQQRLRRDRPAVGTTDARDIQALEKRAPETALEVRQKIAALVHGRHRSQGAPELCRELQPVLSRRSFYILVHAHRQELFRQQRAGLTRIVWAQGVWAMDPGQLAGRCWNLISDLASRFRFDLTAVFELPARAIADQLARLFACYGAPLVLKRDNGSNLISGEVDEVLDAFGVIPLNSPLHYPAYNGAIEYAQRELKARVETLTAQGLSLEAAIALSPPLINAKSRPCLGGQTAADVFKMAHAKVTSQFTLERRKEIKDSIVDHSECIRDRMKSCGPHAHGAAWRQAVEQWLVEAGFVTIRRPQSVSPHFP